MLERAQRTLEAFGVHFDRYFSERSLHEGSPSALDRALEILKGSGELEQEDGAWWLRTERRGDDKDRVVISRDRRPDLLRLRSGLHAR